MVRRVVASLVAGIVFGLGLTISGMVNPQKVLNFLDVAGMWDPTLAFVMGGALLIAVPGFRVLQQRSQPLLDTQFHFPTRKDVDGRLLTGSALFGVGWGTTGFCPGPAITGLGLAIPSVAVFVIAMLAGMALHRAVTVLQARQAGTADG